MPATTPLRPTDLDRLRVEHPDLRIVDVRTPGEFAGGHIPGSVNIPVDDLRDRLGNLPSGDLMVVCAVGIRGYLAARTLAQQGRVVANVDGGYRTWAASPAAAATRP